MPRCSESCTVPLVPLMGNMARTCPQCMRQIHVCCGRTLRGADYHERSICLSCWDAFGYGPEYEDTSSYEQQMQNATTLLASPATTAEYTSAFAVAAAAAGGGDAASAEAPAFGNSSKSKTSSRKRKSKGGGEKSTPKSPKKKKSSARRQVAAEDSDDDDGDTEDQEEQELKDAVLPLEEVIKPFPGKAHMLVAPPPSKTSKWWHAFHLFDPTKTDCDPRSPIVCCNLCGKELAIGKSVSTTSMNKHMSTCNRAVHRMIKAMNDEDGSNTRNRSVTLVHSKTTSPSTRDLCEEAVTNYRKQRLHEVLDETTGETITLESVSKPYAPKEHLLVKAPSAKRSTFWIAFHCFNKDLPEAAEKINKACCNCCGMEVGLGKSQGTANMQKHLTTFHQAAYKLISSLDRITERDKSDGTGTMTLTEIAKPFEAKRNLLSQPLALSALSMVPSSKWMHAYHAYDTTKPDAAGKRKKACCNLCGSEVSQGDLSTHLESCNFLAYTILSEIEDCTIPAAGEQDVIGEITVLTLSDITKPFEGKKKLLIKPPATKTSRWWYCFHCFDATKPGAVDKGLLVCCNLCGTEIVIGKSLSTSSMPKHVSACNSLAHKLLSSIEDIQKPTPSADAALVTSFGSARKVSNGSAGAKKLGQSRWTPMEAHDHCVSAVARCLIANRLPFSVAESKDFQSMLETYRMLGSAEIPYVSSEAAKDKVFKASQEIKKKITAEIEGGELIATAYNWESHGNENILFLTANWIQDFSIRSAVLGVKASNGNMSGHLISQSFEAILKDEWDIEQNVRVPFVMTAIVDDVQTIGKAFEDEGTDKILCIDQLLQAVTSILYRPEFFGNHNNNDLPEGAVGDLEVLKKARMLVEKFQASSQLTRWLVRAQQTLDEYADTPPMTLGEYADTPPMTLVEDFEKKWWSVYRMIHRLFELRVALHFLFLNGSISAGDWLSDGEWDALTQIRYLLKPFMQAPKILDGRKYATASLIPFIVNAIRQDLEAINNSGAEDLEEAFRPKVMACTKELISDIDERFYDMSRIFHPAHEDDTPTLHGAIWYSHALDPRFKKLPNLVNSKKNAVWRGILTTLVETVKNDKMVENANESAFEGQQQLEEAETDTPLKQPSNSVPGDSMDKFFDALEDADDENTERLREGSDESIREACENELQAYKFEPQLRFFRQETDNKGGFTSKVENHPLDWWKVNHQKYPFLWHLAKRYLAIPAVSAPVKRAFQSAGYEDTLRQLHQAASDVNDESVFVCENLHWL